MQPGDCVLVTIADTGQGMDKQTLQRIYEPFFTTKSVGKGTGLGLSVVYGIVKNHQGQILCDSEVGVGTTFRIYLPVRRSPGEATVSPAKPKAALQGGTETILIVDDEAPIRSVTERAFIKLGYTIITARDGESALLRYGEEATRIRLVIMDLGMPGMGGWECLKQLRAINPHLRVLLTTGYGGNDLLDRARQAGAVNLIAKPYQLEVLSRAVREALDQD